MRKSKQQTATDAAWDAVFAVEGRMNALSRSGQHAAPSYRALRIERDRLRAIARKLDAKNCNALAGFFPA